MAVIAPSRRSLRLTLVTKLLAGVNGVARTLSRWGSVPAPPPACSESAAAAAGRAVPERVLGLPLPLTRSSASAWPARCACSSCWSGSRPDVVHIASEGPLGWAALLAAGSLGVAVASSFHTNYDHYLAHYGLGVLDAAAHLPPLVSQPDGRDLVPSRAPQRRLRGRRAARGNLVARRGRPGVSPSHRDPALRQ